MFEAAAEAHRRTGVPILTHCEHGTGALEQIRVLRDHGVAARHIVLSHVDKVVDRGYHRELLATGAYGEYDGSFRWKDDEPNGTLQLIRWMVEDGHGERIVLGMDAARRRYYRVHGGGPGLVWLLDGFTRLLADAGVDESVRHRLFVTNPARAFAFAAAPIAPHLTAHLEEDTMDGHRISMLGTGLIADFYTMTLHGQRGRDRVAVVYSRSEGRGAAFRERWSIPESTADLAAAVNHPDTDVVVVALPNFLHEEAVGLAAKAGKAVLCTKPLGRTAEEAKRMLDVVESAGVFGGYLEDLCYTPKTLKAIKAVQDGALGDVTWVRSRETHPGPHSAWFWDGRLTGGGAIIDLGCHCIEIVRNFVGKGNRPVDVMCHTDTLVHPIADEDNAVALIRFESGAIGQFEVSWTFRGGMDLRDEVAGTHGTIWLNHFLRTGFEMFTAGGGDGYVAEKAETSAGWLFPVGDEVSELGYVDMFSDMFRAIDAGGAAPGDVLRRVRRERDHGRLLPVGEVRAMGGGRAGLAGRFDAAHRVHARDVRRSGRHQARDPPGRPPQADPQGRGLGRLHATGSWRGRDGNGRHAVTADERWAALVEKILAEGAATYGNRVGPAAGVRIDLAQDQRQDLRDAREGSSGREAGPPSRGRAGSGRRGAAIRPRAWPAPEGMAGRRVRVGRCVAGPRDRSGEVRRSAR